MPRLDVVISRFFTPRFESESPGPLQQIVGRLRPRVESARQWMIDARQRPVSSRTIILAIATFFVVIIGIVAVIRSLSHGPVQTLAEATPAAATYNAHAPTHSPAAVRVVDHGGAYLPEYKVLLARSLFSADGSAGSVQGPALTNGSIGVQQSASAFALKGISQEDASFTAFVEDTRGKRMMQLHVGDTVGPGQVSSMTLQNMDFAVDGKVVRVAIGQGLDGNPFVSSAPPSQTSAAPDDGSTTHKKHHHGASSVDAHASADDN